MDNTVTEIISKLELVHKNMNEDVYKYGWNNLAYLEQSIHSLKELTKKQSSNVSEKIKYWEEYKSPNPTEYEERLISQFLVHLYLIRDELTGEQPSKEHCSHPFMSVFQSDIECTCKLCGFDLTTIL